MITYNNSILKVGGSTLGMPSETAVIGGKKYPVVEMPDGSKWLGYNLDLVWDGLSVPDTSYSPSDSQQAMYYRLNEATYGWDGYRCGLLYNWYAVTYLEQNKATLIPGWRVPTWYEIKNLVDNYLGGHNYAGTGMKALDNSVTSNWPSGWNGTNTTGLSILPAGHYIDNTFSGIGTRASVWTSSNFSGNLASAYSLSTTSKVELGNLNNKRYQYSVRLVKD